MDLGTLLSLFKLHSMSGSTFFDKANPMPGQQLVRECTPLSSYNATGEHKQYTRHPQFLSAFGILHKAHMSKDIIFPISTLAHEDGQECSGGSGF